MYFKNEHQFMYDFFKKINLDIPKRSIVEFDSMDGLAVGEFSVIPSALSGGMVSYADVVCSLANEYSLKYGNYTKRGNFSDIQFFICIELSVKVKYSLTSKKWVIDNTNYEGHYTKVGMNVVSREEALKAYYGGKYVTVDGESISGYIVSELLPTMTYRIENKPIEVYLNENYDDVINIDIGERDRDELLAKIKEMMKYY